MAESQGGLILWIIIGVFVAIIVGLIVYMFLPPEGYPGYKVSKGVPKPVLGGLKGILRRRFKRLKPPKPVAEKVKEYTQSYDKQKEGFRYEYKEGPLKKLKKLFKRGKS